MELKAAQPLLTAVNTIEEGERAERDGVAEVDLEPWGGSVDAAVTEGRAFLTSEGDRKALTWHQV